LVESLTPAQVLALGGVLLEHPELLSSALTQAYTAMPESKQIEARQQMNRLFCDRIE
jgi:hypothetical protein